MQTKAPYPPPSASITLSTCSRSGFTLVELLVTLAVAVILLAVAAPSFRDFVINQRVKTASSDIFYAMTLARSEAIKRNAQVTITKAAVGWQDGWTITTGVGPTILSKQGALTNVTITGPANTVIYNGNGRLTGNTAPTFEVTGNSKKRCVQINLSGLPNTKTGACL